MFYPLLKNFIKTPKSPEENAIRGKIEEFHPELKQLTGIEDCQCRKARIPCNHIACALLVWLHLKRIADQSGVTIYQLKQNLGSDYLKLSGRRGRQNGNC